MSVFEMLNTLLIVSLNVQIGLILFKIKSGKG